jgi:5'-3' exonuclease
MGIKDFSKVFRAEYRSKELRDIINYGKLSGRRVSIDAMLYAHRAFKMRAHLTNQAGESTHYILPILHLILNLNALGVDQEWQFDFDRSKATDLTKHLAFKKDELAIRTERKEKAKEKLEELARQEEVRRELEKDEMFADLMTGLDDEKLSLERQIHGITSIEIQNIKFMLDTLGIKWLEAPETFEGECVSAQRTWPEGTGVCAAVITNDADALLYGAAAIIRREKDEWAYYSMTNVLAQYNLTYGDFICIAICLGCDPLPKGIPRIGPATVITKYKSQNYAPYQPIIDMISRRIDLTTLIVHNQEVDQLSQERRKNMLDWLVEKHNFNRDRTAKILSK